MYEFLLEPFVDYGFMRRALLACFAISVGMSPVGVFLILRRMGLAADAMSHTIFPGVALAYSIFGFSSVAMGIGGFMAGIGVAVFTTIATRFSILKEDASLATFHIASLAFGIVVVALSGSGFDLLNFLIGNVLALDNQTLSIMVAGSMASLLLLTVLYRPLMIDTLDPAFLSSQGVKVGVIRGVFLCIVVISLTSGFLAIGPLMIGGLMVLPAGCARVLCKRLETTLACAVSIALLSGYFGLLISFHFNIPSGASIVLFAFTIYVLALIFSSYQQYVVKRRKHYVS